MIITKQASIFQTPMKQLSNGVLMPKVAIGTGGARHEGALRTMLFASLNAGFRHIDTSEIYPFHKQRIATALEQRWNPSK